MRATRTRGWGSRGQAMGVDRKTGEVASRKGVFGGQSWGWRLSVAWLEQRTCGGEGWSQRCWSPCPALGRPTPGTFRLGPRGEGGRSGQEAEEKPGSPGNTGHKWVRRDSGQGRWETTVGTEIGSPKCGAVGKASQLAGATGEGMWLPRAGEPRASGSVPPTCVME